MSFWKDIKFVVKDGALVPKNKQEELKQKHFLENLKEGQEVDMFLSIPQKEKSLAQLAKVHACIREVALESGYTFDEVKNYVKKKSGLVTPEGFKSFSDCDVQELTLAIQQCMVMGYEYNLNLQ